MHFFDQISMIVTKYLLARGSVSERNNIFLNKHIYEIKKERKRVLVEFASVQLLFIYLYKTDYYFWGLLLLLYSTDIA